MARSQNNWPVDFTGAKQDRAPLIRDITVPNGVLAGDVAVVFRWLAREYDRRVERLIKGWCWGWFVKEIRNTGIFSNHSSGTAIDFNAPNNPNTPGATERSLTQDQIDECHAIERESGHVLRWGGDFGLDDPMHWETVKGPAEVKKFADEIRADLAGDEEFDNMDQATFNKLLITGLKAAATVDPLATVLVRTDASTNRQEPELERDVEALKREVAEVKGLLAEVLDEVKKGNA